MTAFPECLEPLVQSYAARLVGGDEDALGAAEWHEQRTFDNMARAAIAAAAEQLDIAGAPDGLDVIWMMLP